MPEAYAVLFMLYIFLLVLATRKLKEVTDLNSLMHGASFLIQKGENLSSFVLMRSV